MITAACYPDVERPDPALVARFAALPATIVSDALGRDHGPVGLQAIAMPAATVSVAGPALTIRTAPGDNLLIHKAIDLVQPGDIVAIDGAGYLDRAVIGEIIVAMAEQAGAIGFAVDGAIRDAQTLRGGKTAVFARGIAHLGPFKNGPGMLRGPIALGGQVVHQGDVLVGDADGVVVVPRARAEAVAAAAERTLATEEAVLAAIADGTIDRSWLDDALTLRHVDDTGEPLD